MKKSVLVLSLSLTFSYCLAQPELAPTPPDLPVEMWLKIIVSGINQAPTLREAWQFIQNAALTSRQFDAMIGDRYVINSLAKKVKNKEEAQEWLLNFVKQQEVGANTAHMIIATLLKAGADVNQPDAAGETPLVIAVTEGALEMVKELLKAGANPNQADSADNTPLIAAISLSSLWEKSSRYLLEMVKELLKAGANPNQWYDKTPLIAAINMGDLDVVKELLGARANPNQADKYETPLIAAAKKGTVETVKELLKKGANVNQADRHGFTPLIFAAKEGATLEVAKELLKAGADVDQADTLFGNTSLIWAVRSGLSLDAIRELLKKGADVNKKNKAGKTAFDEARTDEIRLLIQEAQKKRGEIAQKKFLVFQQIEMIGTIEQKILDLKIKRQIALNEKKDVEFQEIQRQLIAQERSLAFYLDQFKKLMTQVTMDIADADGNTSLHKAVQTNNLNLVKWIFQFQPDLAQRKNKAGQTPIGFAAGRPEILRFFMSL